MQDVKSQILSCKKEIEYHLNNELLPFWFNRSMDKLHGGYITHFDKDGKDTGEDEKSMSRWFYHAGLAGLVRAH